MSVTWFVVRQRVVGVQLRERHRAIDPLAVAPLVLVVGERHGADRPVAAFIDLQELPTVPWRERSGSSDLSGNRRLRLRLVAISRLICSASPIVWNSPSRFSASKIPVGLRSPWKSLIAVVISAGSARVPSSVAPLVVVAAGVAEPVVVAVGVVSGADLEVEHQPVGDAERADVDAAAAERRGWSGE